MHPRKIRTKRSDSLVKNRSTGRPQRLPRARKDSDDVRVRSPSPKILHDLSSAGDNDRTLINRTDEIDDGEWTDEEPANDDDVYFHWDEEDTLLSDLLEEATPDTGDAGLIVLAESLQKPFDDESRQLKKEIAKAFVPLVNKVKGIYASIDRTVDLPFGAGLLSFNNASKELEKSTSSTIELLQKLQTEHRTRVGELLGQLEEEYGRREELWVDFKQAMDDLGIFLPPAFLGHLYSLLTVYNPHLVNPVLEMLNEAPAKLERTIGSIEKQGRILETEGAAAIASATELTLQDIISKLK